MFTTLRLTIDYVRTNGNWFLKQKSNKNKERVLYEHSIITISFNSTFRVNSWKIQNEYHKFYKNLTRNKK